MKTKRNWIEDYRNNCMVACNRVSVQGMHVRDGPRPRRARCGGSAQFLVRLDQQKARRERLADRLSDRLLDVHHVATVEVLQTRFEHCVRTKIF